MILQEIYKDEPWRLLVGCILLNLTTRKQVDRVRDELFDLWPDPWYMADASIIELERVLHPCGMASRKSRTLISMSRALLEIDDDWSELEESQVAELPGIGPYGCDSYRIFILGDTSRLDSGDKVLMKYLQEHRVMNGYWGFA